MKAISVKQPWAWALFHGKPVENRAWSTKFRGDLLIHASKNWDWDAWYWLRRNRNLLDHGGFGIVGSDNDFNRVYNFREGVIIGKVTMIDCVTSHPSPWFFGPYGFVFTNPVEFKTPITFRGALKLFDVPDELIKGAI